jgi:uncharacterized protein YndB with AHSA1/START domain
MPRVKTGIEIDAPREHVFAAAEPSKLPDWTIHVAEVVVTGGDGKSQGTTDTTYIKVTPRRNQLDHTWTDFRPGEAWARKFTGYFEGEERMTFTPEGNGTKVEWTYNYTPPYGILGKIGALLVMSRVVQNNMESSLENLKRELEL